jgi:hypothetical protein
MEMFLIKYFNIKLLVFQSVSKIDIFSGIVKLQNMIKFFTLYKH